MPYTPRARHPKRPPHRLRESRQVTSIDNVYTRQPLATVSRGPNGALSLKSALGSRQFVLETVFLRRLASWGLPAICLQTLYQQFVGLKFKVVNAGGEQDEQTSYYADLIEYANDLDGGSALFFGRLVLDLIACQTGALYEVVRYDNGVPAALYNFDGETVRPTWIPTTPFVQYELTPDAVYFSPEEIDQLLWRPFADWDLIGYNLSPLQVAYTALTILASADKYNAEALNEMIPMGLLNLGPGFNKAKAWEWKSAWDAQMRSGTAGNLAVLYGTDRVDFKPFRTPIKDMGFQESNYWYAGLVAATFGMTSFDLGIAIQRVSTGAAAEAMSSATRTRGLKPIIELISRSFQRKVLPEGYRLEFEDIDPRNEREEAATLQMNAQAIQTLVQAIGMEAAMEEALARKALISGKAVKLAIKFGKEKAKQEQEQEQAEAQAGQQEFDNELAATKVGLDSTAQDTRPTRGAAEGRTQP